MNTAIVPVDTVACWTEALTIRGSVPTADENVPCAFQWQEWENNTWVNVADNATEKNMATTLQPVGGDQIYRRLVISTSTNCVYTGNASTIHVQPLIEGNTITPDRQELCGDHAQQLTGPEPTGGIATYNYRWQVKTEGMDWTYITGAAPDHQPVVNTPELAAESRYDQDRQYRRYVTSGVCNSTSNEVTIHFDEPSSPANIAIPNANQVGSNALKFKFNETLEATAPNVGTGIWSSPDENLSFDSPNESTTTVSNLQLGLNTVVWTVTNGTCASEPASMTLEVVDIAIPNGFSPNGDGINECFRVLGGENAASCEVVILDRYSNVVFESRSFIGSGNISDCSGWWDGRSSSGKELPTGSYFYQIILNGDKVYKGYVVLKKQ
jgi:gliding motility-associated-like protein